MQFESLAALWEMQGHGPYVWTAYGIAAVVLMAIIWVPLARRRRFLRQQRQAETLRQLRRNQPTA